MASEHEVALILNEWKERGSTIDLHIELPTFSAHLVGKIHLLSLPPEGRPTTAENRRVGLHDDQGNWIEVPIPPEQWNTFDRTEEIPNTMIRNHNTRHGILSCLELAYHHGTQDGRITLAELGDQQNATNDIPRLN